MKASIRLQRLMVFVDETDKYHGHNLAQSIVERAKQQGIAGATVLRGLTGFGRHKQVHTAGLVDLAINLPELILIIDTPEKVAELMPHLEEMIQEGLVVIDDVDAIKFSAGR